MNTKLDGLLASISPQRTIIETYNRANEAIMGIDPGELSEVVNMQNEMALAHGFTYLLGPISIALRPRLIKPSQLDALEKYCSNLWTDCLTLEKMWLSGELDGIIKIEDKELEIARMNPWGGSSAIIASDGLFSFGANL